MSAQQVAKLEALLARVNSRRHAQREAVAAPAAAAAAGAPAPTAPAAPPPAVAPAAPPTPAPAVARAVPAVAKLAEAARPQPAAPIPAAPTPAAPAAPAPIAAAPRPAPAPVVPPAPATPVPASAAASPVTAPPPAGEMEVEVEEGMAEVDLEGLDEEEAGAASLSDSVADLDQVAGPRDDHDDDVPDSSRRPIQLQPRLEELAFGDTVEAKPPHPAPPESRRQVATSEFDGELSGVRATPEIEGGHAAPTTPPAAAAPLQADVTRPAVGAASPAVFRGAPPVAKPATFGELLDLTLGL